jgi:hypothetical protein
MKFFKFLELRRPPKKQTNSLKHPDKQRNQKQTTNTYTEKQEPCAELLLECIFKICAQTTAFLFKNIVNNK